MSDKKQQPEDNGMVRFINPETGSVKFFPANLVSKDPDSIARTGFIRQDAPSALAGLKQKKAIQLEPEKKLETAPEKTLEPVTDEGDDTQTKIPVDLQTDADPDFVAHLATISKITVLKALKKEHEKNPVNVAAIQQRMDDIAHQSAKK